MKTIATIAGALLLGACASGPTPETRSALAPTGTLRVAVLMSNPVIARTTPALGRELADSAGVPAKMIEYPAINLLMGDAGKNAWDVAVVAFDPGRTGIVDFAPAHLFADGFLTVLVPPGSSVRSMADLDQPGKRVAAVRAAATAMTLQRQLKQGGVALAENEDAAFALMKDGSADGYAQNRFILRARQATLPGSRIIDDAFADLHIAFAVPKGRPAAAQYVTGFVAQAKQSGAVQRAIDGAGMTSDVKVAP